MNGGSYFQRTEEALSPMKAATPGLIGTVITLAVTAYGYSQAAAMAAGTYVASESSSRGARKGRFLDMIFSTLGTMGTLLVGLGIAGYFAYSFWNRFKNPPMMTKLER